MLRLPWLRQIHGVEEWGDVEETVCSIHRESNPVHPATECSVTAVALYMWVGDLLGYATFVEEAVRHLTYFVMILFWTSHPTIFLTPTCWIENTGIFHVNSVSLLLGGQIKVLYNLQINM